MTTPYKIAIFIEGHAGLFQYEVSTKEQAMDHFAAITSTGYRRLNDRGHFEWYSPQTIRRIKIVGEGLETQHPDQFVRT
ncbi:hypothetical protein [Sneathiella glossodoripedis]|uniref:hypothetical protein n=1 Tax=Sneathiella glossodoripedis TaxID=418853 RepID=UPI0004704C65|nr:hypothetical protein [Sneathiella glossodoripedis]